SGPALKADPARLSDEAAAISFTGGRRAVRISGADDGLTALLTDFLGAPPGGDTLIVVEAGDLGPRASLRKLFDGADNAASLPCYTDDGRSLGSVIRETLGRHNVSVTRDSEAFLMQNLGSDRMVSRSELEKLALYVGDGNRAEIADVIACVGDSAGYSLDDIVFAAAGGDGKSLDRCLGRAFDEGIQPIVILRAMSRHMQRLHLVSGIVNGGASPDQAMKKLRPPVFFKQADVFRAQLRVWRPRRIADALEILTEAELDCKINVLPAETICGRALMRIAQAGRSRQ
ncbi:MAG: DNA polymerase III subunit delta, partial [Rhodospirillales bacterium]|nr:DNA polymerase III subunit delta [Rhodospirillales bacterium]